VTQVVSSYSTPVAAMVDGAEIKTDTFWSKTTSKHINAFLRDAKHAEVKPQSWFDELLAGANLSN